MARYIDAEVLKKAIVYYYEHTPDWSGEHYAHSVALKEIDRTPTADVVEVKRGHWVENKPNPKQMKELHDMGIGKPMALNSIYWTCSECNGWGTLISSFCPHCGAMMDGSEKDEVQDL